MKADPVYVLVQEDCHFLVRDLADASERVPVPRCGGPIVVDIVERRGPDCARLVLHYPDDRTVEGWTWLMRTLCPVRIEDPDGCLFDGRFNAVVPVEVYDGSGS